MENDLNRVTDFQLLPKGSLSVPFSKVEEGTLLPYLKYAIEIYKDCPNANHSSDKSVVERILSIAKLLRDGS